MKLSKKEKEVLSFYAAENLLAFIAIVLSVGCFAESENFMFLLSALGFACFVTLNELRSKL